MPIFLKNKVIFFPVWTIGLLLALVIIHFTIDTPIINTKILSAIYVVGIFSVAFWTRWLSKNGDSVYLYYIFNKIHIENNANITIQTFKYSILPAPLLPHIKRIEIVNHCGNILLFGNSILIDTTFKSKIESFLKNS